MQLIPNSAPGWSFDLSPDGRSIAVMASPGTVGDRQESVHVEVLLNSFDEVRRRVPEGK